MPILCSKGRKMGVPKPKSAQKPRFCAQLSRDSTATATATATPRNRYAMAQQKRRQPFGLSPLKIGGYLLSHMVVQYHRRK